MDDTLVAPSAEESKKEVIQIIFLSKKSGLPVFKVFFTDSTSKVMNNLELRERYPQKLLEFY